MPNGVRWVQRKRRNIWPVAMAGMRNGKESCGLSWKFAGRNHRENRGNVNNVRSQRRIQLSRKKGWRLPPNTLNVARPSKYGNPHRIGFCPVWRPEDKSARRRRYARYYKWVIAQLCGLKL